MPALPPSLPCPAPFRVCAPGEKPDAIRGLGSPEGVGDRLRTAGFAEFQAREAFMWAAERFTSAPAGLRAAWRELSIEEDRHLNWIVGRMRELGIDPGGRAVSARLWNALTAIDSPREFSRLIALAEERGRQAGISFSRKMRGKDPLTAKIFEKIAAEEETHVALPSGFY